MWGLLAAFGLVGLLAKIAAVEKSDEPVLRPALQGKRLARILRTSKRRPLTKTEAEDGLVLARRLGEGDVARRLEEVVRRTREGKSSSSVRSPGRVLDDDRK